MKKILAMVVVLAMVLSLTACGTATEDAKAPEAAKTTEAVQAGETKTEEKKTVTLEFLCWGAAEATTADAFKAMLDGFMEKYSWITVEVTESNYDAVNTSLLTRFAAGDAPDVAQVSNQWVATYYEMGGLLPLDEYMSAETLPTTIPAQWPAPIWMAISIPPPGLPSPSRCTATLTCWLRPVMTIRPQPGKS